MNVRTGAEVNGRWPRTNKCGSSRGKWKTNRSRCDATLETAWVNSVLALGSSEHPELVERVNRLLANVGAAKLSLMYEDELRRLGDDGVPPLLAYLASTRETPNVAQRATAAPIVADVAQARWIPDLIALLTDANADVRFHAARGLERLTGRDQGCKPKRGNPNLGAPAKGRTKNGSTGGQQTATATRPLAATYQRHHRLRIKRSRLGRFEGLK